MDDLDQKLIQNINPLPKVSPLQFILFSVSHPQECIERICTSVNCRQSPLICWQCSIDSAEHVKQHRQHIERFDAYLDKLQESFVKVCEIRQRDAEKANIEGLDLRKDKESNIEKVIGWADDEKHKIAEEIKQIKQKITNKCDEIQAYFDGLLDEEVKKFEENYEKLNEMVETRYGFNAPLTLEEIQESLQKENNNGQFANEYFLKLKEKLQNPVDLNKNPTYMTLQSKIKLKLEKPQKFMKTDYITKRLNESLEKMEKEIFNIKALFQRQLEQDLVHQKTNSIEKPMEQAYPYQMQSEFKKMQSGKKTYGGYSESYYGQSNNEYSGKKFQKKIHESSQKPTPLTHQLYNQIYQENESDLPEESSSIYSSNLMEQYHQEPQHQCQFVLRSKLQTNHTKNLNCVLFIPKLKLVATGSKDKKIKIWKSGTWEQVAELEGHEDAICALAVTQNQNNEILLVSGSLIYLLKLIINQGGNFDSALKIWDLQTFRCIQTLAGHQSSITCILSIDPQGIILSGSYDNNIMVWNQQQPSAQFILKKHSAMISCINEVFREGNVVQCASASWDKSISIWVLTFNGRDLAKCEYVFSILTNHAVLAMCLIDPGILLYGGTDTMMTIYNLKSRNEIKRFPGSQFGVNELHRFDQNTVLGLSANDYSLRLWDLEGNEIAVIVDPDNFVMSNFNTTPKVQVVNDGKINCLVANFASGKQWVTSWEISEN